MNQVIAFRGRGIFQRLGHTPNKAIRLNLVTNEVDSQPRSIRKKFNTNLQ